MWLLVTGRRCGHRTGVRKSHIKRDTTDIISKAMDLGQKRPDEWPEAGVQ